MFLFVYFLVAEGKKKKCFSPKMLNSVTEKFRETISEKKRKSKKIFKK